MTSNSQLKPEVSLYPMRIIAAQLDFWVGAIHQNSQKIIGTIQEIRQQGGDLVVFPELALCGYPPEDLLRRTDFRYQIQQALHTICQHVTGVAVLLGYPDYTAKGVFNAASLIRDQQVIATHHKCCLMSDGVLAEQRYFQAGQQTCLFNLKGLVFATLIGADIDQADILATAKKKGAALFIALAAAPFDRCQTRLREVSLQQHIQTIQLPLIYANNVGGQDEMVLAGGSLALAADGTTVAKAAYFQEILLTIDITVNTHPPPLLATQPLPPVLNSEALVYQALVLALQDYVAKNNLPGVLLGLSGGIDSALVLAIAVDALGKERVQAVLLPSHYTSKLSTTLALTLCHQLAISPTTISIEPSFNAFVNSLNLSPQQLSGGKTLENIQARCRGILLMALSNQSAALLLNTSNKSEIAVGYGTLYGDTIGGFALLKDIPKTLVYRLAAYRNQVSQLFPKALIHRPPTAELAPNQTDEANLLPYPQLDLILQQYVEQDKSLTEIVAAGFPEADVRRVIQWVDGHEYKRHQAPPGPCISQRAFNRERRYPITSGFMS